MRGKADDGSTGNPKGRITPAYAGKRDVYIAQGVELPGSPPPMRGKGIAEGGVRSVAGITPAYAGKRIDAYDASNVQWDHPRLCGEKTRN